MIEEVWDEEKQVWKRVQQIDAKAKYVMNISTKKGEAIIKPLTLKEAVRFHKCIARPKELQKLMVVTSITELRKVV